MAYAILQQKYGIRHIKKTLESQEYRNAESFRLENFKIVKPNPNPALPSPPLNHVPQHHIYPSFKYLQGWQLHHFPGQPVPMLDNPFSEEIFPNIQSKPPLAQLEAISSCPVACHLGDETDLHLTTTCFQVVAENNKFFH
ncbi:protein diaphanous hypothetical protein [Limosa lapponica baueri]|uniref:Uncharacterized protein n=1 Tax=Limosa lapponica baueri TaxID=1758121 RepID=A0A2I0T6P6_LIMLA|nr:protein diaphanous hypothetical protein [Limosa lapponica baueri]